MTRLRQHPYADPEMAEPTLKDVLAAIAQLRAEMATKTEFSALRSEVNARFDRVDKELGELDKDLTGHMKVHRELEKDIELLKRRPPRTAARVPRRR